MDKIPSGPDQELLISRDVDATPSFAKTIIESFGNNYEVDPLLLDAVRLDKVTLFPTGIPSFDERYAKNGINYRTYTLGHARRIYDLLAGDSNQQQSHPAWIRGIKERLRQNSEWLQQEAAACNYGLARSSPFGQFKLATALMYFPEALARQEILDLEESDLMHIFGTLPETPPRGQALGHALQQQGAFDYSPELFDQRMRSAYGLAQFAAADLILKDLLEILSMGGGRTNWAKQIFNEYRSVLFADNVAAKLELQSKIRDQLLRYANEATDPVIQEVIEVYAKGADLAANDLEYFTGRLVSAHQKYERPLPAFLEAIPPKPLEASIDDREEVYKTFEQHIEQFVAEARRLFDVIHLSRGTRRKQGFAKLEKAIVEGYKPPGGQRTPKGIIEAGDINVLICLAQFAREPDREAAIAKLNLMLTQEVELNKQLETLQTEARANDIEVNKWPETFHFADQLNKITNAWEQLLPLIQHLWPDQGGATAAQGIGELLAVLPRPSIVVNASSGMSRSEALRDTVIHHLNTVIFPRDKKLTQQDVDELMRQHEEKLRQAGDDSLRYEVHWERVRDLVEICNELNGELYETKAEERIFGENVPWFVAVLTLDSGQRFIVAESPILDHATYILPEYYGEYHWYDILINLRRTDTQVFGARAIRHSTVAPHGEVHVKKVVTTVRIMDRDS